MNRLSVVLTASVLGMLAVAVACGSDGGGTSNDTPDATTGGDDDVTTPNPEDSGTPDPDDAGGDPDADAAPPYVLTPYDINHVLGTGQSLSVGAQGAPALSTTQPYDNMMFNTGVIAGGTNLTSFVDLKEASVETLSSAFANEVSKLAGATKHDLLVSGHGIGGQPYSAIKKGGTQPAYANGMAQLTAGHDLAFAAQKTYVVRAVTNVHGESDHQLGNALYKDNLLEFQTSYETDVKAKTAQAEPVPMFITQYSSWTKLSGDNVHDIINGQMLAAHLAAPGKIILVGAKYYLPHFTDGVHLTNVGYEHLGEDYAKVYKKVILEGKTWEPLRPQTVSRAGKVVTVKFFVPAPPLVIDTTTVSEPTIAGTKNGFEFAQTGGNGPIAIESVALAGADTVTITLASEPTGTDQRIRYAFTGTAGALGGPTTGPRGNLRDSDATESLHGFALYNWCIHFDQAIP